MKRSIDDLLFASVGSSLIIGLPSETQGFLRTYGCFTLQGLALP